MRYLHIHFTPADLGRTRLALRMDHMWEIVSAAHLLQHREGGLYFGAWRRRVHQQAHADPRIRELLYRLVHIAPYANYFPDFLTPPEEYDDLNDALHAVVSVPKGRLRAEMALLGDLPAPLRAVREGGVAALRGLHAAFSEFQHTIIGPELDSVEAALRTDLARRIHTYLHDGVEAMLAGVCPHATWNPPVLTLPYPINRDLALAGRGLRLVPSYFTLQRPVALADPSLPPTLVFPIDPATRLPVAERNPGDRLGALVGSTRAAILGLVMNGCSTRDLIRRVGVAPSTITHHTTVLREAGMIITHRDGGLATHHITPLGIQLLSMTD